MERNDRYPWQYSLYMIPYFLSSSVFMSFISVYFKGLNLSQNHISVLMASIPAISILSQPLWGSLGDRANSKTWLLRLISLGAMVSVLLFALSSQFWWLVCVMLVFSAFYTALQPLGDAIILEALHEGRRPFGPLRLLGCLAFALSSAFAGRMLDGHMSRVIWLTSLSLGGMLLGTLALPNVAGHQRQKSGVGFGALLKVGELRNLLILVVMIQASLGYFYAFYSIHFLSLPGSSSGLLGISYLVSSLSEVPFLICSDKLFEKLGAGKLLLIAALALALRWVSLAVLSETRWVMLTQLLHGWGFVVVMVSMAKYVNATVPPELRARGQMLVSMVGFGIARVIGTLGGGLLAGKIGLQNGFFVTFGITALALVIYVPRYLRGEPLNGQ